MQKFDEVDSNLDLAGLESEVLRFWQDKNIFEKVRNSKKDKDLWIYYDGPITANGMPHYGHAITWTMKDVLPRYWTMKGYNVPRNMGWDCQGILVEYEVEKNLGFQHKSEIEEYGIDKFNQKCRESVLEFRESMIEYEQRLGRWLDEKQYSTMNPDYIESMWWSLKKLYDDGLLYEGHKVVAYSTRAGMTLSAHEVAEGGYKEVIDTAVTLKFELADEPGTYILAWTTTPWTLPGNLMLSVGKNIDYVKVEYDGSKYILAEDALGRVFKDLDGEYKILEKISAKDIKNLEYKPLFDYYKEKHTEGAFKVIYADHVNTEEGTGIVHLAPYGEEDFNIFMEMGMTLFDYLDETGSFTAEIPDYQGMFYKQANKQIILDLQEKNLLFKQAEHAHQMPICYRTKEPLIYKPIKSWYVAVNKIKTDLVKEVEKVNFVPEEMGKRFLNWIKNARDWSLSRRRFWGTPMPVWVNDKTGDFVFVGSFSELQELSGQKLDENFDPHRPFVDEITWEGKDGGTYKRVPEVIDVWYDSGSMPYAQHHYPFENKEKFEKQFPAEYISESDDQIRLWFYTMFVLNVALFGKAPFKNVIVSGMLGDETGKKMSKSKGNYPPIEEVFNNYGSDMLRYFLLSSPIARGQPTAFSYNYLVETKKEFFGTLWNSYRYFLTYANLNHFAPQSKVDSDHILDRWIVSLLAQTKGKMDNFMQNFEVMYAVRELAPFVNDLSTWYIRRSRERISAGDKDSLNVLYKCLFDLSKLMAPFMPLLSEEIYQNLAKVHKDKKDSVHMEKFPEPESKVDQDLIENMEKARKVASIGNSIRKLNQLPVRQPLSELVVSGVNKIDGELVDLIKDELNMKKVSFKNDLPIGDNWLQAEENGIKVTLNSEIDEDLKIEGAARELMREIQKLRKQSDVDWDAEIEIEYESTPEYDKAVDKFADDIKQKTLTTKLVKGSEFKVL